MKAELQVKAARLREMIAGYGRVAVAFSGGVDSSLLLAFCVDVLGPERVLALTADSPLLPRAELAMAQRIATWLGAQHRIVPFDDLAIPEVAANPPRRCYHCKRARFEALLALLHETGGAQLIHGENADDHLDYRPGSLAAQELGIPAPLALAGLGKAEIRALARERGLPNWDYPSAACLASRFPYGTPLTREGLERVEKAEARVQELLQRRQVRVRDHFPLARIEVAPEEVVRVASPELRPAISAALHELGYRFVTVDLDGYRMGSLNDGLTTSR